MDKLDWEELKLLVIIVVSVICATSFSVVAIREHTKRIETFVSNGYTRQTLLGTGEVQWVKIVKER